MPGTAFSGDGSPVQAQHRVIDIKSRIPKTSLQRGLSRLPRGGYKEQECRDACAGDYRFTAMDLEHYIVWCLTSVWFHGTKLQCAAKAQRLVRTTSCAMHANLYSMHLQWT
jgi:hypothetical protein